MEKDEFFFKRIRELANVAYQRDIVTFSDFLNLNEQHMIHSRNLRMPGVVMESFGGYENAERQMAAFHPDALVFPWEYPIDCIRIVPNAPKFSEKLTHRDYLGALLNLGVERSVIGDILVQEDCAWFFCHHRMAGFFLENLTRVRQTPVRTAIAEDPQEFPGPRFETIDGVCASVRLDSLIALAFHASRSSMTPCIEGGLVFVNGRLVTSNGYEPREGDVISVRKKGRFLFESIRGQTKKGRIGVRLQKYI